MTLLFVDGFDHTAFSDLGRKWNTNVLNSSFTSFPAGRFGGSALRYTSSSSYLTKTIPRNNTVIIGFAIKLETMPDGNDFSPIHFRDYTTNQCHLRIRPTGYIEILRWSGVLLGTSSVPISLNAWTYLEIKITFHNTAGAVTIRLSGVPVLTLTNVDTQNSPVDTIDQILFCNPGGATSANVHYDDLYIANNLGTVNNDFLGDVRVETLRPTANGFANQFARGGADSGANWSQVDDATPNDDTDYVFSSVSGDRELYDCGNLSGTPASIFGVQLNPVVRKTDAGTKQTQSVVRIGSTEYPSSNIIAFDGYAIQSTMREQSPATSAAWTPSEVNGSQYGIKVV